MVASNFQYGFQHYLYLAHDGAGAAEALDSRAGALPAINFNTASWVEYSNVRTVTVGGSSNSVDITTRDEARSGFSTEVDATTTGEMSFEVRYKRTTDAGVVQDWGFEALLKTWLGRTEIAAMDLDQIITGTGAQGLVGNWTVSFTNQKEVAGVVLATVTMKLSSFPNWVRTADGTGTNFAIVS